MSVPLSPRWRWDQAQELLVDPSGTPQDDGVRSLLRYLRNERQSAAIGREGNSASPIAGAVAIAHDCPLAEAIEIRILAGEPVESIASHCGVSPAALEVYESSFFDVRRFLGCGDYVIQVAVGAGPDGTLSTGQAARLLAYWLGAAGVEVLLGPGRVAGNTAGHWVDPGCPQALITAYLNLFHPSATCSSVDDVAASTIQDRHHLLAALQGAAAQRNRPPEHAAADLEAGARGFIVGMKQTLQQSWLFQDPSTRSGLNPVQVLCEEKGVPLSAEQQQTLEEGFVPADLPPVGRAVPEDSCPAGLPEPQPLPKSKPQLELESQPAIAEPVPLPEPVPVPVPEPEPVPRPKRGRR